MHSKNKAQSKQKKLGKKMVFIAVALIMCLSVAITLETKHWEYYDETAGTIRRMERRQPRINWNACLWLLQNFLFYVAKLALLNIALYLIGIWSPAALLLTIGWIGKDLFIKAAIISYEHPPISRWLQKIGMRMEMIAIIGALLLSFVTQAEASSVTAMSPAVSMEAGTLSSITLRHVFIEQPLGKRYKITIEEQQIVYRVLCENPKISTRKLIAVSQVKISIGQLNRIRKSWGFARKPGRPCRSQEPSSQLVARGGLKVFAFWLESNDKYQRSLDAIYDAIEFYANEYPEEEFRLLHSKKETIAKKWKALVVLSLLGIKRLSELDYHPHDLSQILGYTYSYSTLRQFLGELERVEAGYCLKLMLSKESTGEFCYIDPHLFAYWTRKKMHKGLITNKGKVMPGSKLFIAQNEKGQAIDFEYHPPDTHIKNAIEAFCANIAEMSGITKFIIDREANGVEIARMFAENGWKLVCMLDKNEYDGLEDFNKRFCKRLEDGTELYKATWNPYRKEDPREFVLAYKDGALLVYSGTSKITRGFTAEEFISLYHRRTEIQENSIKDMIAHGALDINYGRKKIQGPDRHHQRKVNDLKAKIETARSKFYAICDKISDQIAKLCRSIGKNRTERVNKQNERLQALMEQRDSIDKDIDDLNRQIIKLGPTPNRADRDFRKQEVMTYRSLWLENELKEFQKMLALPNPVDIETLLQLFFFRPCAFVENDSEIRVHFGTQGLSRKYRELLNQIVASFNRISLVYKEKLVRAEVVGFA